MALLISMLLIERQFLYVDQLKTEEPIQVAHYATWGGAHAEML